MIRAILFDLDNTLTDFMKMKDASISGAIEAMIDMGLQMTMEKARERIYTIYDREGIEYQQVFDRFLQEELGIVPPGMLAAAIVGYRRVRDFYLVLYPHVRSTLTTLLRRGMRLAVLSDAPAIQAWLRLHHLALHHVFEFVITFDDTGERKPSPAGFLKVLELLRVEPSEALMVGDWPERDMVGASRLGIRTVFARYGDSKGVAESGADFEVDDILEILEIVERLNAGGTEDTPCSW